MTTMANEHAPTPGLSQARILIVDDEVTQMQALCDTLSEHGFETVGFAAAEAALEALATIKFDILLSDLMMPGMDGIALLKAAQTIDPDLVGVIMTGEGTIASAVDAMKVGALDYILKPFKLSVVLPVLSRALTVRQLRLKNAELEKSLHERATELEAANKELEMFSYSVSHDLRAPLRAVSGFAKILTSVHGSQMSEEARRVLGNISYGAGRMEQLVEALLNFSRLGRHPLAKRPIDLTALARKVAEELRTQQPDRQIDLRVGELPQCVGDRLLLEQVFVNLLSNAFKFTRDKENAIVEVGCREQNGELIYFVRDNGAGFDMRHASKLFGTFQRLHREEEFEGTGVGLSIVSRIVQRHGGRIWAEAALDQGAMFQFTLPE